eukprot:470828-Amphidinium_carterae.1
MSEFGKAVAVPTSLVAPPPGTHFDRGGERQSSASRSDKVVRDLAAANYRGQGALCGSHGQAIARLCLHSKALLGGFEESKDFCVMLGRSCKLHLLAFILRSG